MDIKYIIVIIDTFTRIGMLSCFWNRRLRQSPQQTPYGDISADLRRLSELITDFGSQFFNDLLTHFHQETVIKHDTTIPFSKEENGAVDRANKELTLTLTLTRSIDTYETYNST